MENYQTHILPNGLRIVHMPYESQVSYCGVIIDVGSRDECDENAGMAHFVEHMLFKGTNKRKSAQIINRLEDVGGELNAYTSKEETVVYAGVLTEYTERAIELIADLVQFSIFPQSEIDKEISVVQDEIQSYNDSPSELIYDDFEEMLFDHHPMGHNVMGSAETLEGFTSDSLKMFFDKHYRPDNMLLFSLGATDFDKIVRWAEKFFTRQSVVPIVRQRVMPHKVISTTKEIKRDTYQSHCLLGCETFGLQHPDRITLVLLNNILGGPGMNSLLNYSLRERKGLVYSVDSSVQLFTDCGWWGVYFGTDAENMGKCERLVRYELQKLCETKLSEAKLKKYKRQLLGQMVIASENKENVALTLGKSFLRYGKFDANELIKSKIESVSSEELQSLAQQLFDIKNLKVLRYK